MSTNALFFALKALCIAWVLMVVWRKYQFRFFLWVSKMRGEQLLLGKVVKTEVDGVDVDRLDLYIDNLVVKTVSVHLIETNNVVGCVMIPDNLDRLVNVGSKVVIQVKSIEGYKYANLVSVAIPDRKWWLPFPV